MHRSHTITTRITILLPFLCLAALSQAQPVITNSAQPQPGDACPYVRTNMPTSLSTSAGGGQIWDLTGMSFTYVNTITYVAASATLGHDHFPTATLAATDDNQNYYKFYTLDPMRWSLIGTYSSSSGDRYTYSDPMTLFVYPSTFGTQWDDPFSYTENDDPTVYHDTISAEFNAWGTVILPGGGTVSVIGSSTSFIEIDTVGTDVWTHEDAWVNLFSPNSPCQMLKAEHLKTWLNGIQMDDYYFTEMVDDPNIGVQEVKEQKELELWPVPARTSLNVRWGGHVIGADAQVIDVAGKVIAVRWTSTGVDAGTLDVSGLVPGTYLLRLSDDAGRWMVRSFVVQ